ncbi:hypothetical protein NLI96_g5518 [Meripilus lineatus]|uniref:F-box domain-containing protein n=1 Tax=Meripilus lineatus TaxID=2056292 RepID=A0AAD5V4L2_9APHY|nr:hypothetical protein NLI96_g5518 [Physisporinus lineatus]
MEFPPELVQDIVLSLPFTDIVKFRQLSRTFKRFIDDNSAVQYRVNALAHDIKHLDAKTAPVVDKLKELLLYITAQNTLQTQSVLVSNSPFAIPVNVAWEILEIGLVVTRHKSNPTITISQFPSLSRVIPFREWNVDGSNPPIISVDPSQDLLVLIHLAPGGQIKTSELRKLHALAFSIFDRSVAKATTFPVPQLINGIDAEVHMVHLDMCSFIVLSGDDIWFRLSSETSMSNPDDGFVRSRPRRHSKPTSKITDPSNIASFQLSSHAEAQLRFCTPHPPSTPNTRHTTLEPSDDGSGPESDDVQREVPSSRMTTPAALTDVEEVDEAEEVAVRRRRTK